MKSALVLGANGQDGSFLVERLLLRGYKVVGIGRQKVSQCMRSESSYTYKRLDLRDAGSLRLLLDKKNFDVIFHVAAVHGSAGTPYEEVWQDMLAVNEGSVQVVLEYLRTRNPSGILIYASSGKVFGPIYPEIISELSPAKSTCLYTITKMGAKELIDYYRSQHKIRVSSLFLFNHESYRRPQSFFVQKVVSILAESIQNSTYHGTVHTLEFACDWGCAEEYMDIAIDISEKAAGEDFVIGSGKTWSARLFVKSLFDSFSLDYRQHIIEQKNIDSPVLATAPYHVDTVKLQALVGRTPEKSILQVCDDILKNVHGLNPEQYKVNQ